MANISDQITLLGAKVGPAIRQGGAMPTSSALQLAGQTILIDCGIGASRSAVEAGISLPMPNSSNVSWKSPRR